MPVGSAGKFIQPVPGDLAEALIMWREMSARFLVHVDGEQRAQAVVDLE